ncbi:MAG: hypothetical protein COA66_07500 [Arcobacter sp.]|nr:MAG: hypothetical protein COA66_07500 [Arcobacter sp.]
MNTSKTFLEITLKINETNREAAVGVYTKYKAPFLTEVKGAKSKDLLIRNEDVQVLHGFDSVNDAQAYLESKIFSNDVVNELTPLLEESPEIRIYSVL